jgi:small subunit ribosomal protein S20
MYRSRAKTVIRKAEIAIYDGQEDSVESVQAALRTLDKAAGKGILHPNNVARRKSRLVKKLRLAQQAEATA